MTILYDIIFAVIGVLYFPYLLLRGKWHSGFKMRLGRLDPRLVHQLKQEECLWIHAVSVGEVLAVLGLIERVHAAFPSVRIVCSTVTVTGHRLAQEKLSEYCRVIYAPLDFSWVVRTFVNAIRPLVYISTETELWPNLYAALHQRAVPILQVNGRISDKAFRGYRRVRGLARRVLNRVDIFCMQSPLDAQRVLDLGAPPERVRVVGNLKFDFVQGSQNISKSTYGFLESDRILIAGSTHPGEEAILLEVFARLSSEFSRLRLVLAPRHVERAREILELVEKKGYQGVRLSEISKNPESAGAMIVVDTIGHLRDLYQLAEIVVIGKTFAVGGGQNMIEPAFQGKPTIVGPMTQNFKDVVQIFLSEGALVQVKDRAGLLNQMREFLNDPEEAQCMGKRAQRAVLKYQGATEKTVEAVRELFIKSRAIHPGQAKRTGSR